MGLRARRLSRACTAFSCISPTEPAPDELTERRSVGQSSSSCCSGLEADFQRHQRMQELQVSSVHILHRCSSMAFIATA